MLLLLEVVQLLITAFGFYFIYRQFVLINKTIQFSNETSLYVENFQVRKNFLNHPELRQFFFDGLSIDKSHEKYLVATTIAEMYLNYLENLTSKSDALPKIQEDLKIFIKDVLSSSPLMLEIVQKNSIRYRPQFRKMVSELFPVDREMREK